jgi:hypothetical protein
LLPASLETASRVIILLVKKRWWKLVLVDASLVSLRICCFSRRLNFL